MENNLPIHLQEIIFGSSDSSISKQISKLKKDGQIKKIAPRLYTSNLEDPPETIVRRNLYSILGNLYPGAVLSHRSALEFKPTSTGQIFLTYSYTRKAKLPGITIRFLKGNGPIEGDNLLSGELYTSQRERALLENLQSSRKSGPDSKTLTYQEIEERLEQIVRINSEEELNKVRDQARVISKELEMTKEFKKLDKIISALLATQSSKILKSPIAAARAFGVPYDPSRYELFEILYRELIQFEFKFSEEKNKEISAFNNFAFFESYFSNYIEGIIFKLDQAKQIIETQTPLPNRSEDSHDVLGTYQIVSNRKEMNIVPNTPDELISILKYRHKKLLYARTDKKPGEFKDKNNYAGQTAFVDMNLVKGTILKSFDFYNALKHPFSKAAYIMFVISEVHPFLDGNGRIARIMMNAELVSANQSKLIIPTVYREDYILVLRKLTRQRKPDAFIRMLSIIHEFSSTIFGSSMLEMQKILEESNAFLEPSEGKLKIKTTANNG
ncbi:MAG: Fic family protein [Candidatus Marinimicrobia bacterium]|nr:Fic family protein [Candidatus Neomarinimicrobiota bacterium]